MSLGDFFSGLVQGFGDAVRGQGAPVQPHPASTLAPAAPITAPPPPAVQVAPVRPAPTSTPVSFAEGISDTGLRLIQLFEQCRLTAYPDSRGIWTIGWGHAILDPFGRTTTDKEVAMANLQKMGLGWTITQAQADALFRTDLAPRIRTLGAEVSGCTQGQFDAMASLLFNIGSGNFATSHVRSFHNADNRNVPALDLAAIAERSKTKPASVTMSDAFSAWSFTDGVWSLGLFRRRAAELMIYRGETDAEAAYRLVEAFRA